VAGSERERQRVTNDSVSRRRMAGCRWCHTRTTPPSSACRARSSAVRSQSRDGPRRSRDRWHCDRIDTTRTCRRRSRRRTARVVFVPVESAWHRVAECVATQLSRGPVASLQGCFGSRCAPPLQRNRRMTPRTTPRTCTRVV
jgi:hypothetical protein